MSRVDVRRDLPIAGTHLTELQLQEMWYCHIEQIDPRLGKMYREHKRLFPRSRRDLIQYFTEQDLGTQATNTERESPLSDGQVRGDSGVRARVHEDGSCGEDSPEPDHPSEYPQPSGSPVGEVQDSQGSPI